MNYPGMLAAKAKVTHIALDEFLTHNPARLMFLKSAQNPMVYNLDHLAGPTKREFERAKLLENKARWCWLNKCYNNIYFRGKNVPEPEIKIAKLISNLKPNKWVNEHLP